MDEQDAKTIIIMIIGFVIIIIIGDFSYQTYNMVKSVKLTLEYKIFGTITIITLLYYLYKIFEKIYEYRSRKIWKPSPELVREFYAERKPEPVENYKSEPEVVLDLPDERVDININLDLNKGLFYGRNLNIAEKHYLINHKYQVGNFVPIGKFRQEECWVKENHAESLEHTFLVHNIKQELEKYTEDIEINITEKPDLIFKNIKGDLVAIEVETGLSFDKHEKRLDEKFYELKKRYKKNAIILLTDTNMKYKYKKINNKVPILVRTDMMRFIKRQFT
jgi:hypothetical protein